MDLKSTLIRVIIYGIGVMGMIQTRKYFEHRWQFLVFVIVVTIVLYFISDSIERRIKKH